MKNLRYNTVDMKLIFAQGNPGKEYENTRHNIGFLALDYYASRRGLQFKTKQKFNAQIAEIPSENEKTLLVKPLTYYNETGVCAQEMTNFYKIPNKNILVVHDDLALPFGTLRTREKGSSAGNNGIKSLNTHLGENYHRLRIGTWNERVDRSSSIDFVLSKFNADESEKLINDVLPKATEIIDDFIGGNHVSTSHKV